MLQVSANTPSSKLKALRANLQAFAKAEDGPDGEQMALMSDGQDDMMIVLIFIR